MLTVMLLVCLAVLAVLFGVRAARSLVDDRYMDRAWIERQWRDEMRSAKH